MTSKNKVLVDVVELQEMLSCNKQHACRIGKEAKANIRVGRRYLYHVDTIDAYLKKNIGKTN